MSTTAAPSPTPSPRLESVRIPMFLLLYTTLRLSFNHMRKLPSGASQRVSGKRQDVLLAVVTTLSGLAQECRDTPHRPDFVYRVYTTHDLSPECPPMREVPRRAQVADLYTLVPAADLELLCEALSMSPEHVLLLAVKIAAEARGIDVEQLMEAAPAPKPRGRPKTTHDPEPTPDPEPQARPTLSMLDRLWPIDPGQSPELQARAIEARAQVQARAEARGVDVGTYIAKATLYFTKHIDVQPSLTPAE